MKLPLLLLATAYSALTPRATATGPCVAPCSDVPAFVPKDFDCAIRKVRVHCFG
jgi:hypothetical protein